MKKYAKITNEETKACEVGTGTNTDFYRSIGMSEMEVEQGYDGQWYLAGYAPQKPQEVKEQEVRAVRNQLLKESDWTQTLDAPLREEEKEAWRVYRQALRDVPAQEGFPENVTWPEVETLKESGASDG